MNILVTNWLDIGNPLAGGAELHVFEIFKRLAARGHRVRMVCSGWSGAPTDVVIDGIQVQRISTRNGFALHGRGAVRRALAGERPDIVVEDINKLPLFLANLTALPFCAMVPHLFGATAFQEASWPAATIVWLGERPLPRVYRRAGFHAISESTRDDLVARGVRPDRIRVIHPGVDSEHFTPGPAGTRAPSPSFLYVGRLKRYKGVDVAIRALAIARRARADLRLDIAGSGDHRSALELLSGQLGLGTAVTFHGFVSEEEKIRLLRQAWGNVFPSPKEGWGITVVEAGACGTPSLASDSPGLRDSVRHGETGFLTPHGEADALAERMLQLAADPTLVEQLGLAARRFAEAHTWDRSAEATELHLHDIIADSA